MCVAVVTATSSSSSSSSSFRAPASSPVAADRVGDDGDALPTVLDETVVFRGPWRSVLRRRVRVPGAANDVCEFDVVDQNGAEAVAIVAFCSRTRTFTSLREYNPGSGRVLRGPAAGLVESKHRRRDDAHADAVDAEETAARCELEEECRLRGGAWHRLGERAFMDKYATTTVTPFLVIDAVRAENPRPRDAEEDIEIVEGATVDQVRSWIREGEMNLVGAWVFLLAIRRLEEMGLL